jgi:hypothetical protein
MLREELINLILTSDDATKEEIIKKLKSILLKKDAEEEENRITILEDADLSGACCLPSICITSCDDCETQVDADVNVGLK